jgi:RNA ligase
MKSYPSINKEVRHGVHLYAFDKLDGSNIRAEWNSKKGFYKFGSRNQLIDQTHKPLGKAIPLIQDKYAQDLAQVFKEQGWKDALCFFEFYGPSSFAGLHSDSEEQTVTLFDVNPYKQGILEPAQFIKLFGHLEIPKILYQGHLSIELMDGVKQSTLSGMTFEGVICKGANDKKTKMPIMFKIKSKAWLDRLKEHCKGDEDLFNKLS